MRPVLLGDAIHLAAALAPVVAGRREALLDQWLDQTHAASKYAKRFGLPHPAWGDGSLTSRALKALHPEEALVRREGPDFLLALALVAKRLAGIGQSHRQPLS